MGSWYACEKCDKPIARKDRKSVTWISRSGTSWHSKVYCRKCYKKKIKKEWFWVMIFLTTLLVVVIILLIRVGIKSFNT